MVSGPGFESWWRAVEAVFTLWLYGALLHRALHYDPSIVLI